MQINIIFNHEYYSLFSISFGLGLRRKSKVYGTQFGLKKFEFVYRNSNLYT